MIDNVNTICIDLDGTLTDGVYAMSDGGEITKTFYTRDIFAIEKAISHHIGVHVVTLSRDPCARHKFDLMKYPPTLHTGINDKKFFIENVLQKTQSITWENICYIGDAENDLGCINLAGWSCCPCDAIEEVAEKCNYISSAYGGYGAVYDCIRHVFRLKKMNWLSNSSSSKNKKH